MTGNFWRIVTVLGVGLFIMTVPRRRWQTPPAGEEFEPYFELASNRYGLPPGLLSRVAYQESRYDVRARSGAGAEGIMQIVPRWHPGVEPGDEDPIDDIFYAAKVLRQWRDRFGSWELALAAYNGGPTRLAEVLESGDDWFSLMPEETQNYVRAIGADALA